MARAPFCSEEFPLVLVGLDEMGCFTRMGLPVAQILKAVLFDALAFMISLWSDSFAFRAHWSQCVKASLEMGESPIYDLPI